MEGFSFHHLAKKNEAFYLIIHYSEMYSVQYPVTKDGVIFLPVSKSNTKYSFLSFFKLL